MNVWMELLAAALVRTTVVTSLAAVVAMALLALLRVRSAKVHRVVWLLVIAQGWCLTCFTWQIEVVPSSIASFDMPAEVAMVTPPDTTLSATPANEPRSARDASALARTWGLAAWSGGIGLLIVIGATRYVRLFASGRPGELPQQPQWIDEWQQVCRHNSVRRAELRITRDLGPLVCWVPRVLLVLVPRTLWSHLTPRDRLAILRHELAHCERGDLWKNLAVRLFALPQWFNPLVWLAVRRFEEAGEWACDEHVARAEGHATTEYATTLLRVGEFVTQVPCGAAGVTGGLLSRRVKRLLHLPDKEVWEMRGLILPILLFAIVLLQAIRIEHVVADEPAAQRTPSATADGETNPSKEQFESGEPKLPPYVIEPPDVLLIDVGKVTPKSPPKGDLKPMAREHLVGPDGRVNLGSYGAVYVSGMTIDEAKKAIDRQLSKFLVDPDVTVDVFANNSKKYYIIQKSPTGDNIAAFPITGNETVLDAIAVIGGLRGEKDKTRIWIDRPTGNDGKSLIKPVDYQEITVGADTSTNYQLWPGDRVFLEMADDQGATSPPAASPAPPEAANNTLYSYQEPKAERDGRAIKIEIRVITDPKRNLRNIEGLAEGHHIFGDSQLLEGLLAVLANNDLSQTLASPTLATNIGRVAKLQAKVDDPTRAGEMSIVLLTRQSDNQVLFEVRAKVTLGKKMSSVDTAFALAEKQSYLVRLPANKTDPEAEDLYLIISRRSG